MNLSVHHSVQNSTAVCPSGAAYSMSKRMKVAREWMWPLAKRSWCPCARGSGNICLHVEVLIGLAMKRH
jgi:hypothetical protein